MPPKEGGRIDVLCLIHPWDLLLCAKWSSRFWTVAGVSLGYASLEGDMHYSLPVPLGMTLSCYSSMHRTVKKNVLCC